MMNFDDFYNEFIENKHDELEKIRFDANRKYKANMLAFKYSTISVIALSVLTLIYSDFTAVLFLVVMPFYFIGTAIGVVSRLKKHIKFRYKKEIILPMLNYLYEDVKYKSYQKISVNLIRKSLLLKKYVHTHKGDDYIKCRIGNAIIQFSEIEACGTRSDIGFFNGVFIAASFNKYFKSKTIVYDKRDYTNFKKSLLNLSGDTNEAEIIKLEDSVFNKKFKVIGENQIESRYILSTSFMQRLLDYNNKMKKNVSFSFVDNKFFIVMPNAKNMLEPTILKSIYDKEYIELYYNYLLSITDLVHNLDLNTRIWTKE